MTSTVTEQIRVLLVEDYPADVLMVRDELEHVRDIHFEIVHGGRLGEALEWIAHEAFDAVLLDLNLPDSQGLETYKQLHAAAPHVPIVILSGRDDEDLATQAVHEGAQDYLVKGHLGDRVLVRAVRYAIERERVEQSLRESEERFRATFEQAAVGFAHVAPDGTFQLVNQRLCDLLGYTRPELGELTFQDLTVAEDRRESQEAAEALLAGDLDSYAAEKRYRRRDGSVVWLHLVTTLVRDQVGRPKFFVSVIEDITTRKAAVKARADSESRFRAIFENAGIGIAIDDPTTTSIMHCNPALARVLGYRVDQLSGMTIREITHPEDYDRNINLLNRLLARESAQLQMEKRYLRSDGSVIWGHLTLTLLDLDGQAPPFVVGMVEDITERKRFEQDLKRSNETLQTIFDAAPLAIVGVDVEGRVTEWNSGAERLLGWSPDEVIGTALPIVPMERREDYASLMKRVISAGPETGVVLPVVTKNDELLTASVSAGPVRGISGNVVGAIVVLEDITKRRKLEEQLLRAQRMESIGTLAGGIAHDLNNVLAPILMSLDVLKQDEKDPDRIEILETIEASASRGADMVRQVLSFARGVDGQRKELQVRHILRDMQKIVEDTFGKDITLTADIARDLWTINGDATQLHQVVLNLCLNARDAMAGGGTITLKAENVVFDEHYAGLSPDVELGRYIVIQVEDSGQGMDQSTREQIFDPFFTTKEVGKGTGLGLSTSLAIVESHGGFVRVYSEPGVGSKFRVYLPACDEGSESTEGNSIRQLPRGNGELVLVVDDEASVREITKQTLEAFGYSVLTAADGAEAVAVYSREGSNVDVVITDMVMPVLDGPGTIKVLMKLNPDIRIIATSGLDANGLVSKAVAAGVHHFLPKPFSAETLLRTLRDVLA